LLLRELPLDEIFWNIFDLFNDLSFVYTDFLLEVRLTPIDLILFLFERVLIGQAVNLCSRIFGYIVFKILL
jgi:hypothetical protein